MKIGISINVSESENQSPFGGMLLFRWWTAMYLVTQ